jgi:DNA-binding transcriptional regulator YdaS (Cro superfamily)
MNGVIDDAMQTASDIINVLGGNARVADHLGVGPSTVSEMKRRNSIPVEYFPALVRVAEREGVKSLTLEKLVKVMANAKRVPKRRAEQENA